MFRECMEQGKKKKISIIIQSIHQGPVHTARSSLSLQYIQESITALLSCMQRRLLFSFNPIPATAVGWYQSAYS